MRRNALLASAALLVASGAALAQTAPTQTAPIQTAPAQVVPAQITPAAARIVPQAVLVRTGQHSGHGRIVLHIRPLPPSEMRKTAAGWEIRLRGPFTFDLATIRPLAEVTGIEARQDGEDSVLLLRAAPDSRAELASANGMLWVDVRGPAPAAAPAPTVAAAATPAGTPLGTPPGAAAPRPARQDAERRRLAERAVEMGLMTREQAETSLRPQAGAPPVPAARGEDAAIRSRGEDAAMRSRGEDAAMRDGLIAQIGRLNAPAQPTPTGGSQRRDAQRSAAAQPAATPAAPPPEPPRPSCAAPFTLVAWAPQPGAVRERLTSLREALARSEDGPEEIAALAEFYVAHQLAQEAIALAEARPAEAIPSPAQARLARSADVARLLLRRPLPETSPLLAETPGCDRVDLPLWRALSAAATGDAAAAAAQVARARTTLREVPERLRYAFAMILADAVGDDAEALRTLLAPLRLTPEANETEMAGRAWLQARIARLEGNRDEEMQQLARAARAPRTLPGLFASVRLAGLQAARSGPDAARAETELLDVLRTYRFDSLGEEAAVTLGNLLLARGDFAGALAAGESAGNAGSRSGLESRGAQLIARILRRLLTDETGPPPAEERLALWWRYEGYATPGERGDDIRLGAGRLLLAKGFPEAALDTLRTLAPATLAKPDAATLLAQAEARSPQGDAQRALAMLRALPVTPATQRAMGMALSRLERPLEAARALDGLTALPDRAARAAFLYTARDWVGAAAAYADLLRDPALDATARPETTARYASAVALAGTRPGTAVPDTLLNADAGSQQLLQAAGSQPLQGQADASIASIRAALERARGIEHLIPAQGSR